MNPEYYVCGAGSPLVGAGLTLPWRRYPGPLAQVSFFAGYLRRKSSSYAFEWRRSPTEKLICAKSGGDLRQMG